MKKDIEQVKAQAAAIHKFREAVAEAKKHLPPIAELEPPQRRVVLCDALEGLNSADLPYFRRAISLLMGQRDRTIVVPGGWRIKHLPRGQIRHRMPNATKVVMVEAP